LFALGTLGDEDAAVGIDERAGDDDEESERHEAELAPGKCGAIRYPARQ
jgi:hypothetical protein